MQSPLSKQLQYGFLAMPISAMAITILVFFPKFILDSNILTPTILGGIILFVKVFDFIIDPIFGRMSDEFKSKGYTRSFFVKNSYMPLGILFSLLFLYPLFINNFNLINSWFSIVSLSLFLIVFFIFWTSLNISYQSLGVELESDYHRRTKLLGIRDAFIIIGTLVATILPVLISTKLDFLETHAQWFIIACFYFFLSFVGVFLIKKLKEPKQIIKSEPINFKGLKNNRPFYILSVFFILTGFGSTMSATTILIYLESILEISNGGLYLFIFFLSSLLFFPLWMRLAKKFEKKLTLIIAMIITSLAFMGVLFLEKGDHILYLILIILSGIGIGGCLIIPSSMQADIAEFDGLINKTDRRASLISIWSLLNKASASIAAGLAFPILGYFGYKSGILINNDLKLAIKILYAGIPLFCYFLATIAIIFYPLDKNKLEKIKILEQN